MDETSALMGVSEIAVAVAGFSGVATALGYRDEATSFSSSRRLLFGDLIIHSGIALFCSMAVVGCLYAVGSIAAVWITWSIIWAFCAVIGIVSGLRREKRKTATQGPLRMIGPLVLGGFALLLLLQLYNAFSLRTFWPFFAALLGNLAFAFVQFARLAVAHMRNPLADDTSRGEGADS